MDKGNRAVRLHAQSVLRRSRSRLGALVAGTAALLTVIVGAITLIYLVLIGNLFVVWTLGITADVHIYFTLGGVMWFFLGVQNWKLFLIFFPQYVAGVKAVRAARGGGRGPVSVDQSGLVVRSGGHMGAFAGQAWLPAALPAGVTGADIQ